MTDEKIVEELKRTNVILEGILNVMKTPRSKIQTILEYGGASVGILGILGTIDIIKKWMLGG
ncbi:MAG: hypothetical protein Ta2B_01870 [Termitinemataceae bacterium]|nr:MAG: hypothetical protein Ta2B_01870 [Termitinemataceae bacterium]